MPELFYRPVHQVLSRLPVDLEYIRDLSVIQLFYKTKAQSLLLPRGQLPYKLFHMFIAILYLFPVGHQLLCRGFCTMTVKSFPLV